MPEIYPLSDAKVKHTLIADEFRRQIVGNVLTPGSQLPTRAEIVEKYQVSSVTVQKALDQLIRDGFVDATRRKGSFVSLYPPHQCRYALVLQEGAPAVGHTSRYMTALAGESARIREPGREMVVYYRVDGYADNPDYRKLLYDVRARRLAGMIFPYGLGPLANSPLIQLDTHGAPSVVVISPGEPIPGIPIVDLDARTFVDKALDYLATRGRTRIAVLSGQAPSALFHSYMAEGLAARQLTTRPYWNQYASVREPETARNCAHLMMMPLLDSGRQERPDGLIIADDNLVEHASIGLLASGVRVSEEVDVIAHCNFPWSTPSLLPSKRLGYDIRELLLVCIGLVNTHRRGEMPPVVTHLSAKFEDEVSYNL